VLLQILFEIEETKQDIRGLALPIAGTVRSQDCVRTMASISWRRSKTSASACVASGGMTNRGHPTNRSPCSNSLPRTTRYQGYSGASAMVHSSSALNRGVARPMAWT
jgi:hypothetical protein